MFEKFSLFNISINLFNNSTLKNRAKFNGYLSQFFMHTEKKKKNFSQL